MITIRYSVLLPFMILAPLAGAFGQVQFGRDLQYFRPPDARGINIFETPKDSLVPFDGVKVRIGGSNTLQFQALEHGNSGAEIFDITNNFNLATSNLDLDVQLHRGLRMHLRTYLSSRHHPQPYVKGGYIQVDRLDFIRDGFMGGLMDKLTLKVGHMEVNYGDAHFRRTDNGQAIFNPFVGNYIMDAFTTEVGAEFIFQSNGFLAMGSVTNGRLNQSVVQPPPGQLSTNPSVMGKIGYDKQLNEDLRVRLTGSVYHTSQTRVAYLYTGDRAGSRYYNILTNNPDEFRTPRYNPGFTNQVTAIMFNPFVKYRGLEFFGIFENSRGKAEAEEEVRTVSQYGAELIYRIGSAERLFVGGRYNMVAGTHSSGNDIEIARSTLGAGWFLTKNVLVKLEYVDQQYVGFDEGTVFHDAYFRGGMLEAVVSF
jgi:hypothetical protein